MDTVGDETGRPEEGVDELHEGETDASITRRVHASARKVLDDVADRSEAFEQRLRHNASDAEDRVKEARDRFETPVTENFDKLTAYVREHPVTSAGLAFVAGIVVSRLLRK